jgi:protocatechuate 3,4-dioxygenase beta subunit
VKRAPFLAHLFAPLFLLALAAYAHPAHAAQIYKTAPTRKEDQCRIAGVVVKLAGSEPLNKVHVRLQNADDRTRSVTVVTDTSGHFVLPGIDPGRYNLSATRLNYVTVEYGQRKPEGPGATLTLHAGQEMKDLVFRMIPSAVIAGHITDEDGEPLPRVHVSAQRESYEKGKRKLTPSAAVETDDLGAYRLYGLPPGRYFISAVYSSWAQEGFEFGGDETPQSQGYAKLYYPGVPEAFKASAITVKSGEEISSTDMLMRQVAVYSVRGHVYNGITQKPGNGAFILLMPRGDNGDFESGYQRRVDKPDGTFTIPDVVPGSYSFAAAWFEDLKVYATNFPVDVGNADVEGVSATITQGVTIGGQIVWEGKPSLEKDDLYVSPRLLDDQLSFGTRIRINQTYTFALKDMGEGTYHLDLDGLGKDCYVKDIQFGQSSVIDDGFTVARSNNGTLQVTVSSRGGRIQGSVVDQDGLPAAGVFTVLIPKDKAQRSKWRLYKQQNTDQYGRFDLRGIAPGDYLLLSWDEVEEGAWGDPEFLKPFEEKAEKISIQDGDVKPANLISIRTGSAEKPKD